MLTRNIYLTILIKSTHTLLVIAFRLTPCYKKEKKNGIKSWRAWCTRLITQREEMRKDLVGENEKKYIKSIIMRVLKMRPLVKKLFCIHFSVCVIILHMNILIYVTKHFLSGGICFQVFWSICPYFSLTVKLWKLLKRASFLIGPKKNCEKNLSFRYLCLSCHMRVGWEWIDKIHFFLFAIKADHAFP